MADRKARSFIFKIPPGTNLGTVRNNIQEITGEGSIKVFQEINALEYLVELTTDNQIQEIIEHGFDSGENHINCHPPRGYYLNVSIMGLKAYVEDDEVIGKLSEYGEVKGSVIRLKYRQEHELAGLENGNRLIRIVLTAPSIPYSLQIGGEWCRIIHNNQQLICTHCHEPGHARKNCPTIECRTCNTLGHISYHCPTKILRHSETTAENTTTHDNTENAENNENPTTPMDKTEEPHDEKTTMDDEEEEHEAPTENINMQWTVVTAKRPHQTDSDSDPMNMPRKQRTKPKPNLKAARHTRKNADNPKKP